jgi:hypothetical protein
MPNLADLVAQAKNLEPWEIQEDGPLQDSNWNTLCRLAKKHNEILEKLESLIPPVGFVYIRLPGAASPDELWDQPSSRWNNISGLFPGTFLRIAGGLASAWNPDVPLSGSTPPAALVYDTGDNGNGGGQLDAIHNITGEFDAQGSLNGVMESNGAFRTISLGQVDNGDSNHNNYPRRRRFDASYADGVRVAGDVHPKNITVQIWIRDL